MSYLFGDMELSGDAAAGQQMGLKIICVQRSAREDMQHACHRH